MLFFFVQVGFHFQLYPRVNAAYCSHFSLTSLLSVVYIGVLLFVVLAFCSISFPGIFHLIATYYLDFFFRLIWFIDFNLPNLSTSWYILFLYVSAISSLTLLLHVLISFAIICDFVICPSIAILGSRPEGCYLFGLHSPKRTKGMAFNQFASYVVYMS